MYIVHPEFIFPLSGTLTLRGRLIRMQYHKKSSVFFNPFFNIIRAPQKVLAKFPPPPPPQKKTSLGWIGSCEGFYLILKGMAFGGSEGHFLFLESRRLSTCS